MLPTSISSTRQDLLEADVCIVGTGPAGITLARELAGTQLRIILLESGGNNEEKADAELNRGTVISPNAYPPSVLSEGRRRQLGGTANLWNHEYRGQKDKFIRCVPLDELDFEKRDWVPDSGWPFAYSSIVPYYERAQCAFGIGPFDYSATPWQDQKRGETILETTALQTSISQFGLPRHFLKDAFAELAKFSNLRILLNSHLLGFEREPFSQVITAAKIVDADGKKQLLKARIFILAAGGLENPRILLLDQAAGGTSDSHDVVGRYFMDHPSITLGTLIPKDSTLIERLGFYDQHLCAGQSIMGKLQLRSEILRREKMLQLYAILVPHFRDIRSNIPSILKELANKGPAFAARLLVRKSQNSPMQKTPKTALSFRERLLEGYFSECFCGWSALHNPARHFGEIGVRGLVELAPNRENRVMLGDDLDQWGQRKIQLHWQWNELDLQSIRRGQEILQNELSPWGRFIPMLEEEENARPFYSTHHFMGTTRMHADPRQGVVDGDCQVHATKNLFVAGSSLFPTGGCANPTLTIVALAIRLADHLKNEHLP